VVEEDKLAADSNLVKRVLHYQGGLRGQGAGNSINGLWVAHVFAARYGRRVCVHWTDFNAAFRRKKEDESCKLPASMAEVHSWNFGESSTYAQMNETIGGDKMDVLFNGNDWPERQWPVKEMDSFLTKHYKPSEELAKILPEGCRKDLEADTCGYDKVLHLRMGDEYKDRRGIFSCPNAYDILNKAFQMKEYVVLTDKKEVTRGLGLQQHVPAFHSEGLDTWADWVKVLTARKRVFHTPSSFSESALRVNPRKDSLEAGRIMDKCDKSGVRVLLNTETWIAAKREWWYTEYVNSSSLL
jgi:hypothetical protein